MTRAWTRILPSKDKDISSYYYYYYYFVCISGSRQIALPMMGSYTWFSCFAVAFRLVGLLSNMSFIFIFVVSSSCIPVYVSRTCVADVRGRTTRNSSVLLDHLLTQFTIAGLRTPASDSKSFQLHLLTQIIYPTSIYGVL